ncbi:hypothetical protein [Halomonas denitrificans]|nr:hypothetical protein [Halomonas denitrificans]
MSLPSELAGTPVAEHAAPRGIQVYRNLHLWLATGLAITLVGFAPTYFLNLRDATWFQHLHGLSATLWMGLLVVQPWLATRGRLKRHRSFGIVALVLAGMVVASGLAVLPFNIENAIEATSSPFAPATFLYGVTFVDLLTILGFLVAVLMATLSIRSLDDHVLWMASTLFWVLMPALARLLTFGLLVTVGPGDWTLVDTVFWTAFPILGLLVYLMVRIRRAHPALVLAAVGNLGALFVEPIGNSESWRALCNAVFL